MSQRKRRRRRRGRGGGSSGGQQQQKQPKQQGGGSQPSAGSDDGTRKRRRRRRAKGPRSPRSSEDLVRALPIDRPEKLTAPPDGTLLEELIGELQSTWGVPQYPQEYRLLIKVAEPRDRSSARTEPEVEEQEAPERADGQIVREKAPPPQQLAGAPTGAPGDEGQRSPRKRRRRRRRGGSSGGAGGAD